MNGEQKLQEQLLDQFVASSQTLQQVLDSSGVDRIRLARWTGDKRFARLAEAAMRRRQLMDKMEITLQQSMCIQQRSRYLQDKLQPNATPDQQQPEPTEETIDPRELERILRQNLQILMFMDRQQRDRRRDRREREKESLSGPRPHPSVHPRTAARLMAEMDRVDELWEMNWAETQPPIRVAVAAAPDGGKSG